MKELYLRASWVFPVEAVKMPTTMVTLVPTCVCVPMVAWLHAFVALLQDVLDSVDVRL